METPITKEELSRQRDELSARIEALEEAERQVIKNFRIQHLNFLRENSNIILKLIDHDRTSCNDDNLYNGFHSRSDGGYRCKKCALIELLEMYDDEASEYVIDFHISIG